MTKYKLTKNCYFGNRLYRPGEVVDFGSTPAPKGSIEVTGLVEKAKAAATAPKKEVNVAEEDAVLKGTAK